MGVVRRDEAGSGAPAARRPGLDRRAPRVIGENAMPTSMLKALSHLCFFGGFASIVAAILVWFLFQSPDPAHGERFGIFVGLWAPTFFALSDRFERYAAPKSTTA